MLQDVAVVAWLGIIPGAMVAALPASNTLDRITRLALCAAFSPAVVSVAMVGGLAAGFDARALAGSVAIAAAPVAGLLLWRLRSDPMPAPAGLVVAFGISVAIPIGWLVINWLAEPGYRTFGRHNLMHADLIYQLVRVPWPPESTELAGVPMGYGWVGHGFNAALGLVSDRAPTWLFPIANILALASTAAMLARSAHQSGARPAAAALAGALSLLTFHTGLAPVFWFGGEGTSTLIPPITKFLFLDLMPFSFPLFAVIVWSATRREERATWLGALAFPALALVYVAAVPAGLCVVGGVALAKGLQDREPWATARRHGPLLLVGLLSLLAGTWWTPVGPAVPTLLLTPGYGIAEKALDALIGFGPWWLLGLPAAWSSWRDGRPTLAGLMLGAGVLAAVYPVLLAKNLEYKLVLYARIAIAPALAMSLLGVVSWNRTSVANPQISRWVAAGVIALVVAGFSIPRALSRISGAQLQNAVPIDERRFHLVWDDPAQRPWLEALRTKTADNTILLDHGCSVMLGAFADRSLYGPCMRDGRDVAGYTLSVNANLGVFRGQPQTLLQARRSTLSRLYRAFDEEAFFEALDEARALGRPVALHLAARDVRRPGWLTKRGIGREIHADAQHRLWEIPARTTGRRASPQTGRESEKR